MGIYCAGATETIDSLGVLQVRMDEKVWRRKQAQNRSKTGDFPSFSLNGILLRRGIRNYR
jgi:hypothetical protein